MATPAIRTPLPVKPLRRRSLALWILVWSLLALTLYRNQDTTPMSWYATLAWGVPIGIMAVGFAGSTVSRRIIKKEQAEPDPGMIDVPLFVTIITKGNHDVLGALTRAIESLPHFAERFTNAVAHIIIDEGAQATEAIKDVCRRVSLQGIAVELIIVEKSYTPPNGTKFKARAACRAQEIREHGLGDTPYYLYQLDDDTAVHRDTVLSLARHIKKDTPAKRKKLAQGILVFPREFCPSYFMWLVDAIRPGDDLGRFAWTTGRGAPLGGCHGENLLVHSSALRAIGWDFGPQEIVEDSRFALTFSKLFRGMSSWIVARCYGASPATAVDFVKQRIRWAEGMSRLAFSRKKKTGIPLKNRLMIMHNMIVWATGLAQPALVVFGLAWLLKDHNISPVHPAIGILWVLCVSYTCWVYYGGLWANANASGRKHPRVIDVLLLFPVIFLIASPLEGLAGTIGFFKYALRYEALFHVIKKPS